MILPSRCRTPFVLSGVLVAMLLVPAAAQDTDDHDHDEMEDRIDALAERLEARPSKTEMVGTERFRLRLDFHGRIIRDGARSLVWTKVRRAPYVKAAKHWLRVIRGVKGMERHELRLKVTSLPMGDMGNGAAAPEMSSLIVKGEIVMPREAHVMINSFFYDDGVLDDREMREELHANAMHEFGHAFGIGVFNLYRDDEGIEAFDPDEKPRNVLRRWVTTDASRGGPVYRRPHGVAAYNKVFGTSFDFLPIGKDGGHVFGIYDDEQPRRCADGTVVPPANDELMSHGNYLSPITVGIMADLGYDVDMTAAQPYPEPSKRRKGRRRQDSAAINIDTSATPTGVVPVPKDAPAPLPRMFEKYTRLVAPNGRPIHLFAQSRVSDEQLIRAREVMRFYLTDAPGTKHGADKTAIFNRMGTVGATLVFFNTERAAERSYRALERLPLEFQDLYATEAVVEGSADYMKNRVRDATLEEVFHLVHGKGIMRGRPAFQDVLERATSVAMKKKRWFANEEWIAEGSTTHEYIISVIDVYYGLWEHDPHRNGESFGGEYRICRRADLAQKDPEGLAALRDFLPADFSFDCRLAASFKGTFLMHADARLPYTAKSRHLTHVTLTGKDSSNLVGNARANRLSGNAGNNTLTGGGGNDTLNGGGGHDVAVFSGSMKQYEIKRVEGWTTVTHRGGVEGTDRLRNIEVLRFTDGDRPVTDSEAR